MIWKYSVRQLLRTPGKLVLFLLLTVFAVMLLVLGFNLQRNAAQTKDQMMNAYVTRGTVMQTPDSMELTEYGFESPVYTSEVDWEALSALPYKAPLENRPAILAKGIVDSTGRELLTYPATTFYRVVRFSPFLDFEQQPPETAEVGYTMAPRILLSTLEYLRGDGAFVKETTSDMTLLVYENTSIKLKAGESYIALAYVNLSNRSLMLQPVPTKAAATSLEREYEDWMYLPWSENVFSTEEGRKLLQFSQNYDVLGENRVTLIPTGASAMLEPFFYSEVTMKYGRDISPEEYASGAKVCLVPEAMANDPANTEENPSEYNNNLQVGDTLTISSYGALYGYDSVALSSLLPVEIFPDRMLEPFSTDTYKIVGVYRLTASEREPALGGLDIIIPSASLTVPDSAILYEGLIQATNTSFLLENGTADSFRMALEELDLQNISVFIDDMGYGEISRGVEAVALVADILFFAGCVGVLCVLVFFVYLQIVRRKRETAIQVSLGAGRGRAAASLLLSVMLVTVVGAGIGSVAGYGMCSLVSGQVYDTAVNSAYSREYSDLNAGETREVVTMKMDADPASSAVAGALVVLGALVLTGAFAAGSLREEPILMLTRGGDGT